MSARRGASIQYLLTVNAALTALYGFQSAGFGETLWTLVVPGVGIAVALLWCSLTKSHIDLNRVKFEVIYEFEQHLPAAMYEYEWQLAEAGKGRVYRAVTGVELWIPVVFAVLHGVLAVVIGFEIAGAWH